MTSPYKLSEGIEKLPEKSDLGPYKTYDSNQHTDTAVISAYPSKEDLSSSLGDDADYPPMDGGWHAWVFCFSGFILEMVVYGFCNSYGILQDHYMTHPPFDKAPSIAIATVGPVAIALQYIPNLPISLALVRYPDYMGVAMWIGLFLYFVALFCSSFATQVWQLILLQGGMLGLGGTMIYVPVLKLISDWFEKKRGLATGFIFAGGGIGGFIFPYAYTGLIERIGLPWTLRIWALITTLISGVAILGVRPRTPLKKYSNSDERPNFIPPQLIFLKTKLFWSVSGTIFFQGLSYFPITLYIASFTRELSSLLTATITLSLFNSASVVGQLLLGWLSDVIHCSWVMLISTGIGTIGGFLLWGFANSPLQLYFFAIIVGILAGGFSSTWPNIGYEIADRKAEMVGLAITSSATFKGIAALIGPLISNAILMAGKGRTMDGGFGRMGYGPVQLFVGACSLVATLFSVFNIILKPKLDPEEQTVEANLVATEQGLVQTPTEWTLNGVPSLTNHVDIPSVHPMDSLVDIFDSMKNASYHWTNRTRVSDIDKS